MNAREWKHAERLTEWENQIRLCRSSGKTVTRWCQENQINTKTYYKWERICLKEAARRLGYANSSSEMIRVDPNRLPDEPAIQTVAATSEERLLIHCGRVSIEIHSEMPASKIADLVCALNSHVCF